LEVTPAVRATGVTLGAPVKVRYTPGYFEDPSIGADPALLFDLFKEETLEEVLGTLAVIGDTLVFVPDSPFEPRTGYTGVARSVDTTLELQFTTSASFDIGPPRLDALTRMSATRVDQSCDLPDGGYRIDVAFDPATDDGPPGDIEYFMYLSRGPTVGSPRLVGRARNVAPSEVIMAFVVEPAHVSGPICVTVHAVDGAGNVDADTPPLCDDPIQGNYFEPLCTASHGAGSGSSVLWLMGLVFAWILRTRRRR
jgi:hypothetical protein